MSEHSQPVSRPPMHTPEHAFFIGSESDITLALLRIGPVVNDMGFDEPQKAMILTALSELSRNILKYAGHGELRLSRVHGASQRGVELTAQDQGPGIADLAEALQDHYSSGGTLGLGLPGVKRMMDEFEIESKIGRGTRITVRKWL